MKQDKFNQEPWRFRAFALLVAAYFGFACWNVDWMARLGIPNWGVWFMDLRTVLASSDAHALGLDARLNNPLDFLHSPHVYSDWWFALSHLGLDRNDYVWLGTWLAFTFLVAAIGQLRTRSWGETAFSVALLCSPPFLLCFNRGNADLLIFLVLSPVVPCFLSRRPGLRWVGLALLVLAVGLKFYPAVAGVVLLCPTFSRRQIWQHVLVFALGLFVVWQTQSGYIARYFTDVDAGGFFTFGLDLNSPPLWTYVALATVLLAVVYWWRQASLRPSEPTLDAEYLRFILGAVLLVGCYLVTVNYGYRAIFTIWMAPYLWKTSFQADAPLPLRNLSRVTTGLLLVFLWSDGLMRLVLANAEGVTRPDYLVALQAGEKPIALALVVALLGFLVRFVRRALLHLLRTKQDGVEVVPA